MSIRFKLSALFALLFFAAISNALFLFKLEQFGEEKLQWVEHTHELIDTSSVLLANIVDAETGQRGYLLTDNASYLEPYHNGVAAAKSNLAKLQALSQGMIDQRERLALIEKEMQLKFDELDETITRVERGEKAQALALVQQNTGQQHMDKIRTLQAQFANTEHVALEQRKGDIRENRAQITTLIAVELVFFVALAVITLIYLQRGLFDPLKRLLGNVKKIESGEQLHVDDVVEKNEMGHLLSTFYMMSEQVSQREQVLHHKAHHDELTGLKNRLQVYDEIEQAVSETREHGDKLAILFIDLNFFKQVNDNLGHDVGDLLLQETAKRLSASVRSSDVVFRLGGDEFLVIAKEIKDEHGINQLMDKIFKEFEAPALFQGHSLELSISVGSTIAPDDSCHSRELIKYADIAMYAAKREADCDYRAFEKSMLKRASDVG